MFRYIYCIIALFLLQACASNVDQSAVNLEKNVEAPSTEELGKFVGVLSGLKYTNPSVSARLLLPKGWFLKLPDKQVIPINDSAGLVTLEPLVRNTYRLLYLLKYKELPIGKLNTSLIFMVSEGSYVKSTTVEAHAQRVKAALTASRKDYQFDRESTNKILADQNFIIMHSEVNIKGVNVFQEYQSTIMDDRLVTFILTYTSDMDRKDLGEVMSALSFK